jgi:hypothetical protein
MQQIPKTDPIRTNYFDIIEKVEAIAQVLFWFGAVLSIAAAIVPEAGNETIYHGVQASFLVVVVAMFLVDQCAKLYLAPRAADARTQDFLSHAYQQPLSGNRTSGYYNNGVSAGMAKVAAQVFENTLFTKEICRAMLRSQMPVILAYVVIWLVALAYGQAPISLMAASAQLIFSEQVFARLIRTLWLQRRSEALHEYFRQLYVSKASGKNFDALALYGFTRYEAAKATAGLTLPSKVFNRLNGSLSMQWKQLKQAHSIA